MKKFKYKVVYFPKDDAEVSELHDYMLKLGYTITSGSYNNKKYRERLYITNSWANINGSFGYTTGSISQETFSKQFYGCDELASNIEMFKALVAIVDDDQFYSEEWVTSKSGHGYGALIGNNIYKLHAVRKEDKWLEIEGVDGNYNNYYNTHKPDGIRKATKEEIISHFSNKQETKMKILTDYIVYCKTTEESQEVVSHQVKLFGRGNPVEPNTRYRINPAKVGDTYGFSKNKDYYSTHGIHRLLPELSFKEWKEMLKQTTMNKKITGYKLIKTYPKHDTLGEFVPYTTGEYSKYPEYWQPVYQEDKKEITIACESGSFTVEMGRGYMSIGADKLTPKQVDALWEAILYSKTGPHNWIISPKTWNFGCKKGIKVEDLVALKTEWDKLNK